MNFARIQSYVKEILEREIGIGKRIGETEMQQVINDVHREFVGKTNLLHSSAHIVTEASTPRYKAPPNMIIPTRVTLNRKRIGITQLEDLDRSNSDGTWYPNFFIVNIANLTTGSGLNDITSGGTFTGTVPIVYTVEIDGTGSPDTFKWAKDGTNQASTVNLSTSAVTLDLGVTVLWAANSGHTSGDIWTFTASGVPITSTKNWVEDNE